MIHTPPAAAHVPGRVWMCLLAVLLFVSACGSSGQGQAAATPVPLTHGKELGSQHPPQTPGLPAPLVAEEDERRGDPPTPPSSSTRTTETSPASGVLSKDDPPPPGAKPVHFTTYVSSGNPGGSPVSDNVADISGTDAAGGLALHTGNRYIDVVDGLTVRRIDPTTVFSAPLAGGLCCDQVVIYVPTIERFVWYMQYVPSASGEGAFRLAVATPANIRTNFQTAWTYWDFTSADFGEAGRDLDYPDLAYTATFLVGTTNVVNRGRVLFRIDLKQLAAGGTIDYDYVPSSALPVSRYHYSHLAQHGGDTAFLAGHVDTATIEVLSAPDSAGYTFHTVAVAKWPEGIYSSVGLDGTNWLNTPWADDEISGATRTGNHLWLAWTATAGQGAAGGFTFPNAHVRVVAIDVTTWKTSSEMQVWNPDYAFGYPSLDTNAAGEVGIIVGWGGKGNNANTAEGIIGDFVVWYHNGSELTPDRFGDYITIRRAGATNTEFAAFGYYTVKDSSRASGYLFTPYYDVFGH
jgi:hypothetical protein